ncbi:MAG: sulfite exporter TauE/SafE family protein [bacterium]
MSGEIAPLALAWCALALACGGLIKGALGVGTPLLTVPLMALVLPPQTAVMVMALPVVAANLWQAARAPRVDHVVARFWPTFAAILVGTWIGIGILARIDERALLIVVGVAVIGFAALQGSNRQLRIPARMEKVAGAGFGFASGVIGGISSFFGPMLIAYLVALQTLGKDQFVGAISFLYIGAVLPWAIALYLTGLLDHRLLALSALAVAPVALGMALGRRLRRRISERRFERLIVTVLIGSGCVILWRALG